jgi:hypothetical protein
MAHLRLAETQVPISALKAQSETSHYDRWNSAFYIYQMTKPQAVSIRVDDARQVSGLPQVPHGASVCYVLAHDATPVYGSTLLEEEGGDEFRQAHPL